MNKGTNRPIQSLAERAFALTKCLDVDLVVFFSEPSIDKVYLQMKDQMKQLKLPALVKSNENQAPIGHQYFQEVYLVPEVKEFHTTKIIERINQ